MGRSRLRVAAACVALSAVIGLGVLDGAEQHIPVEQAHADALACLDVDEVRLAAVELE